MDVASNLSEDVATLLADARSGKGLTLEQLQALQHFQQSKVWKNKGSSKTQSPNHSGGQEPRRISTRDNGSKRETDGILEHVLQTENGELVGDDTISVTSNENELVLEEDSPTPNSTCSEDEFHSDLDGYSSGTGKESQGSSNNSLCNHDHLSTEINSSEHHTQGEGLKDYVPTPAKEETPEFLLPSSSVQLSSDVADSHQMLQKDIPSSTPFSKELSAHSLRPSVNHEERPIRPGLGAGSKFNTFDEFLEEQLKQQQVRMYLCRQILTHMHT
jgi:hypothetical protein